MSIDKIKLLQEWGIGKAIDMVFNYIINKTFKNPSSLLYYKKLIASLQYLYSIILIFFALFVLSKSKLNNATKTGAAIALIFCLGLIVYFRPTKTAKIAERAS
jgi:hypothetical protein